MGTVVVVAVVVVAVETEVVVACVAVVVVWVDVDGGYTTPALMKPMVGTEVGTVVPSPRERKMMQRPVADVELGSNAKPGQSPVDRHACAQSSRVACTSARTAVGCRTVLKMTPESGENCSTKSLNWVVVVRSDDVVEDVVAVVRVVVVAEVVVTLVVLVLVVLVAVVVPMHGAFA